MTVDFNRLLREANEAAPIEPRQLYASLPEKHEDYGYLRDVQGQVLSDWHTRRHERDVVIKVNTGAGKTIDGLVILQSYLNEGHGPALYVAPTTYLAEQVREEAKRISIATVDDPDHHKYLTSQAIAVVNVQKLFNGRSVFRNTRPSLAPAPIGTVVIDDAHAALSSARSSLSVQIPVSDAAFGKLLALFHDDLKTQSPNALLDVEDQSFSALAQVPFWAWRRNLEAAREILHKARETDALKFAWPAIMDVLAFCRVVFTGHHVTITALCSPVVQISSFHTAKHRIYLTATLADDSVLVTDFGADPESVARPITPVTAGDIGERMILAPMELNPDIAVDSVRKSLQTLAERHNVVVIVPSRRVASIWETYTTPDKIIYADDVSGVVARLRAGHVGLVVLVNKYDGIDLPGNACRVLVLDGLPEAFSADERLETQLIGRISGTDDRQIQRIEQGMGRGVRSNSDHCVVFLLGPRLTQLVADPTSFALFGPATQAQLTQSRSIAGDLGDQPLSAILNVARQALDRDPGWVKFARAGLSAVPPATGKVRPDARHRRVAFDRATAGDIAGAVQAMDDALNATSDEQRRGWLLEQKSVYLDHLDPARAQIQLAAARAKNVSVLRPLSGIGYQKISNSAAQASKAADFLSSTYSTAGSLRIGFAALNEALRFDPDSTDEFEGAFCELGRHLGFVAQRPEHENGEGPDVLWALGNLRFWVIEAKSGAITDFIAKKDCNQLTGSITWFADRYDTTASATPVMVHKAHTAGTAATPTPAGVVITEQKLRALRDAIDAFAGGLTAAGHWDEPAAVDSLLTGHQLRASDLARYTRPMGR